jgi:hypothetical protein
MHDAAPDVPTPTSRPLSKADEVVDEDVNMRNWPQ